MQMNYGIYLKQIWRKYQKKDLNQKIEKSVLENIKLRYDSRQAVIKLSNYLMNILQLYLKLNAKQNMKKDWNN